MKKIITSLFLALFVFSGLLVSYSNIVEAYVNVSGYYRSNGTYVAPHVRSNPNGLKYDNYSYTPSQGLYNKTYGTRGTEWDTPTYITDPYYYEGKALYDSNSYNYLTPSTYSTTSTCPLNSYSSGDSCKCNSGYVVSGSKCVSASLYCSDEIGIMSQYNSLTKKCECMSGYEYNGSSCVYKSKYNSSLSSDCPLHSSVSITDSTKCSCDVGYQVNKSKDACITISKKTTAELCNDSFGSNSIPTTDGKCSCAVGYGWATDEKSCIKNIVCVGDNISVGDKCISLDESCQATYGLDSVGVVGSKNSNNTGQCNCKTGYQWNTEKTSCVLETEFTLPAGCTSELGYSATSGISCGSTNLCSPGMKLDSAKNECIPDSIQFGSNGPEVKELQEKLSIKGYFNVTPNGNFGPATLKAVKLFQAYNGLTADGVVGDATRSLLNQ